MKEYRIIIAGGRDFDDYEFLERRVERMTFSYHPDDTEFVSGTARGADTLGEKWARLNGFDVVFFPADWNTHGKRAGYLRNEQMAEYATHLIAFWDGESKGTAHMISIARQKGLVVDVNYYTKRSPATKVGGISMSFVVHCKKAAYDVYIGRGQGSIFGNPFTHKEGTQAQVVVGSREEAVQAFRDWLAGTAYQDVEPERRQAILDAIPTLKGKVLGCWCAPLACHGDVLAEMANAEPGSARPKLPIVAPGNIHSGTKNGLAVLTNPTVMAKRKGTVRGDFPVTVDGKLYEDAEAAYQEIKWTIPNTDRDREDLCTRVIAAKLEQYPQLVEFITHNGGVTWLSKCSHHVHAQSSGFQYWEGDGFDSAFIRCLIKAYKLVR